jgi:hypothetical protein
MKRCSTCNRTYTDPTLSFCIDDGTPLTSIAPQDETTVVSPRDNDSSANSDWSTPYRPPGSYVPPVKQASRRRAWPWILGILGAFILGIIAISIAAAILVPRLMRSRQNERAPRVETSNVNRSDNSNASEPANSNSEANVNVDTPPPTEHDQVLAQLTDLENEWTVANLNADKKKLERILADDYVGADDAAGPKSKAEYIRTIERDNTVEKWEFRDLRLILTGDRATLSGNINYVVQGGEVVFDFTDKFVWRDDRWQATGSVVKRRE